MSELTEFGRGFAWGLGFGAVLTFALVVMACGLVLDSLASRWPLIVVKKGPDDRP